MLFDDSQTTGQSSPVGSSESVRIFPVVVALLLVAQIAIYGWLAPRGFEFTDEAFYLLNYSYWQSTLGLFSFFGAFFELPFRMLGQSVTGIRWVSVLMLVGSSAYFAWEMFRFVSRREGSSTARTWPFLLVVVASSMFYFGFLTTLRAPSYNLLSLFSMLIATAALFRLLEPGAAMWSAQLAALVYGLAIGVCGLSKATSGALLVCIHVSFFALANHDWRLLRLVNLFCLSIAGVLLVFVALQWAHPNWSTALRAGVSMLGPGHGLSSLFNQFRWEIQRTLPQLLPYAAVVVVAFVLAVRWNGPYRRRSLSALIVTLVLGAVSVLIWSPVRWMLPWLALTILLLWCTKGLLRGPGDSANIGTQGLGLMAFLFALPLAFSFGSDTGALAHSSKAAVFFIAALVLTIHRLVLRNILMPSAAGICLIALCLPTLAIQVRSAVSAEYAYRQTEALAEQSERVLIGAKKTEVLVDSQTRQTLESVISAASAAGFSVHDTILDFTGDLPGLVYALGARPLGTSWLIGGYPTSHANAARLINGLTVDQVRSAWIISAPDNKRAISGWERLLEIRLEETGTHVLVATIVIDAPYKVNATDPAQLTVQLWKSRPRY